MTPISREVCEKYFEHCEKIKNLAEQVRDKIPERESNKFHEWVISGMYQKACKTSRAILILMKKGYIEDAYILLRSLMELTINIGWILEHDTDEAKGKCCLSFIDNVEFSRFRQLHQMVKFKRETLSAQKDGQSNENLLVELKVFEEIIEKKKSKIADLEKRYETKWSEFEGNVLPSIRKRASKCGLTLEYLVPFWMASDFVHSSAVSLNQFLAFDEIGPGVILGENYELVPNISTDLIRFLLGFANAVNHELKIGMEEPLKEYEDYFVKLLHSAKSISK